MKLYKRITDLKAELTAFKQQNKTVGFVPTMGALHNGHLSLINQAKKENDIVVVSIFVNPTQFNNAKDLANYPRTLEKDIKLIESSVDILFTPDEKEIYGENISKEVHVFSGLDDVMEGVYRPGHFSGMAQIVKKFFEIIQPDKAYFGEKDYQQMMIVKALVNQHHFKINIVPGATIREKDGLALSSRNLLLTPQFRNQSSVIFSALQQARVDFLNHTSAEVEQSVKENIEKNSELRVEYVNIRSAKTLEKSTDINKDARIFIAAWAGNIRLIDNLSLNI